MDNAMAFAATADPAELREALKIIEPTVPSRGERGAPRPLRLQGRDRRLLLSGGDELAVTHVEVTGSTADPGEAWIEYRDLVSVLRHAPDEPAVELHHLPVRACASDTMRPFAERPPHAASVDAERFRDELTQLLRVADQDPFGTMVYYGVRFWLIKDALVLQAGDEPAMSVVRIPASVEMAAVGRTFLVSPEELRAVLRGLTGTRVELGIEASQRPAPLFSLSCDATSLVLKVTTGMTPKVLPECLSATAVDSVTFNRRRALRALNQAEDRASEFYSGGWVIVHLDAQPLRIGHERDDAPNDGRVLVVDPARLRTALTSFGSREVSVHLPTPYPEDPFVVTAAGVTFGDLEARHHVAPQVRDGRRSQRRRAYRALATLPDGGVGCGLRPRTPDKLRLALTAVPPFHHSRASLDLCVRDDQNCSRCPIMQRFHEAPDLPFTADRVLVLVQPTIGPAALDPQLWLTDGADVSPATPTTFTELAALGSWEVGERFEDDDWVGFWLVRTAG